jgi:hypothetical protein
MPWHTVKLTSDRIAAGAGNKFLNELETVMMAAGLPGNAAVFGSVDRSREGNIYYINPAASRIASAVIATWGGTECDDPGAPVSLLIGRPEAYYAQNKELPGGR